jgi:hypothetical protein
MKIKNLSSNLLTCAGSASKYMASNYRIAGEQRIGKNLKAIVLILIKVPIHAGFSLAEFSTLKMEAIHSSITSAHTRSTRRHIPEDGIFHTIPAFAWRDWENSRKNKSGYVGVPAGIRTKHLQNTSLNRWPTRSAPDIMIYLLFTNDNSVCFNLYGKLLASHQRCNLGLG